MAALKHQYYGDSRDMAKWTVLVRLARMHDLSSIIQIAMLTPGDKSRHGSQRDDLGKPDPDVRRFFTQERETFTDDPGQRSINRVKKLGESLNPPLSIVVFDRPFRHRSRIEYFSNVADLLSGLGHSTVTFLDPDVGIAPARPTEKHVTLEELGQVWEALDQGSVLAAFQYEQRDARWQENAINLFAKALGIPPREISHFPPRGVSFLSALKSGARPDDLRTLVQHTWDAMADTYDEATETKGDFYRTRLIGPALLDACGEVRGLKILDLGCGQGFFSRLLARAGAHVVGVDLSEHMIGHARRREAENPLGIDYVVLDAAALAGRWPPGSFDMVVSCIAFQDMPEPERVLAAIKSVINPDGRVALLVEHPVQTAGYREWERDRHGRKVALRLDRYFDSGRRMVTWKIDLPSGERRWFQFPSWGRTLEEWSDLFGRAGYVINQLLEPRPTQQLVEQNPDLEDSFRVPYFLIFDLALKRS